MKDASTDFNEPIALSSQGMNNPIIVVIVSNYVVVKGNSYSQSYSGEKKIETCLPQVSPADVRVLCGNGVVD